MQFQKWVFFASYDQSKLYLERHCAWWPCSKWPQGRRTSSTPYAVGHCMIYHHQDAYIFAINLLHVSSTIIRTSSTPYVLDHYLIYHHQDVYTYAIDPTVHVTCHMSHYRYIYSCRPLHMSATMSRGSHTQSPKDTTVKSPSWTFKVNSGHFLWILGHLEWYLEHWYLRLPSTSNRDILCNPKYCLYILDLWILGKI